MDHLSYSSYSSYEACPRSFYLSRVKGAEPLPAWYFATGTAVHKGIDHFLRTGDKLSAEEAFYPEVEKLLLTEPDTTKWLAGGPQDDPIVEDKATKLVAECLEGAYQYLDDFTVHEVEIDVTGMLPGCGVPIKGFVDVLGEHRKHGPSILDWKSSAQKPKTAFQLQTYHALLHANKWKPPVVRYETGLWAMIRPGVSKARPIDLSATDPARIGALYGAAQEKIERNVFPTDHGFMCRFCTMQPNCRLQSGVTNRTSFYDTPEKDGAFPY